MSTVTLGPRGARAGLVRRGRRPGHERLGSVETDRGTVSTPRSAAHTVRSDDAGWGRLTANDFWRELRELRQALEDGAPDWNRRLHGVLQRTATRRHGLAPEVVTCLRELRADEAASRLGLTARLDHLLAEATESTGA